MASRVPAIRPPTRIAGTARAERLAVTTVEEAFIDPCGANALRSLHFAKECTRG